MDDGIMTQEQVNKVFQRFYRGDKSRTPFTKGAGLGLSIVEYMIKPFSPNELITRVKAHLSRFYKLTKQASSEKVLIKIANVSIESSDRKVFINNEEVIFTTKACSLLLFLVTYPNIVWSKEKLFEMIWGSGNRFNI
ncbi:response regulator transcription factor [Melissococcus sp. OM08-11BH]|uniref:response regulator transcription factor n=1 Tax=Enterococcaceae TaxID=81852 RepID=UPI001F16515F|nr:hypothetical protein [Vagococcus sp. CY53-2]UNM90470.1 hypothetical protein MN187_01180 [Vagococcus sp. CY52-2]